MIHTTVGVLALQGDVAEHLRILAPLADARPVKHAHELADLDGLIIPGGESTTIGKLLGLVGLRDPICARITQGMGVFGTCAGGILLASHALHANGEPADQPLLNAMDMTARRNAFGRQVDSFEADVAVAGISGDPMRAVFIRAPTFEALGPSVDVLATVGDRVVVCRQGQLLASSFHPELVDDPRLHQVFVEMIR